MGKRLLSRNHIIIEKAVQKYIKERAEESKKKIQEVPLYKQSSNNTCDTALMGEQKHSLQRGNNKPPVERLVVNMEKIKEKCINEQ